MSAPTLDRTPTANPADPFRRPRHAGRMAAGVLDGVRRLAEALATPLVPSDYLDLIDPLRSGADLRGRIVEVRQETPDAVTIVIRPGRGWAGHVAGQYIRIGIDIDGVRHWRAYSLTHVGTENRAALNAARSHQGTVPPGCISVTTKTIPDGRVSTHLVRTARAGTLVMLDQATGDFTLPATPEPMPAKLLFVTAGSGITPVIGMLRNHLGELADVVHVHCAPTQRDVLFAGELAGYDTLERYRLVVNLDDRDGVLDLAGRLDELVPDWRDRETWTCGPTGLLDAAESHWAAAGLPEMLHTERFRPTVVEPGEGGRVTFLNSALTIEADGGTPILDAGEDAGVLMPSGCRMGICFGCVVTMRTGAVRDLRTGEITTAETHDLPIQTCINAVAGCAELEL